MSAIENLLCSYIEDLTPEIVEKYSKNGCEVSQFFSISRIADLKGLTIEHLDKYIEIRTDKTEHNSKSDHQLFDMVIRDNPEQQVIFRQRFKHIQF